MVRINDSAEPYNNRFNLANDWAKLLFQPSHPLFQSELNEMQSSLQSQITLQGNSLFKEGGILSGLSLVSKGASADDSDTSVGNPNLITFASLESSNSRIDTSNYLTSGMVKVISTSSISTNYPGLKATISAEDGDVTLSFTVKRDSGTLYKLAGVFDSTLTVIKYKIDGKDMHNAFTETSTAPLQFEDGNQVNLSDGNEHSYEITFSGAKAGKYPITLVANPGYDALKEGLTNFTINQLKGESGDDVTPWLAAKGDETAATGKDRNQHYNVSDGFVWLGGMMREFHSQDIDLTGVGKESIGLLLDETIITPDQDPSLMDHTKDSKSQWQKGADRLKYTVTLAYNDSSSVTLYNLQDGKIVNDPVKPQASVLNDILAKRTNDESGSYAVTGFNLWSEKDTTDDSVIDVLVDTGTAYVQGYQIIKSTSTRLKTAKATGTQDMADEVFIYSASLASNGQLANQPVKTVNQVTGNVQVTGEQLSRSTPSANPDVLAQQAYQMTEVYSLDSAKKKTVYRQGVDYNLVNGNQLKWEVTDNGIEPVSGSTYYASYEYQKVFVKDTDYKVTNEGSQDAAVTTVTFDGMSGLKPVEGSQVHVAYTYFLARIDTITMDRDGNFTIVKGLQDKLSEVTPASFIDPNTLIMGYVTVFPNSDKAITQSQTIYRIPFYGLQSLVSRVNNLESNMSIQELRYGAMVNQDPVTLKDTFSDDFTSLDKSDVGNKQFTARVNVNQGTTTIQDAASMELPLVEDATNSNTYKFDGLLSPTFTEQFYIRQTKATGVTNINPFDSFLNVADLTLSPTTDSWVDEKKTTVANETQDADTGSGSSHTRVETGTTTATSTTDTAVEYMRQRIITFVASNLMPMDDNLAITFDGQPVKIVPGTGYKAGTTAGTIQSDGNGLAKGSFTIPSGVRTGSREVTMNNVHNTASAIYTATGINRLITTTNTSHWHNNYWSPAPVYYAPTYYEPAPAESVPLPSGHYASTVYTQASNGKYYSDNGDMLTQGYINQFADSNGNVNILGQNNHYSLMGGAYVDTYWVADPLAQSFSVDKDVSITSLNLYFASMPKADAVKRSEVRVEIRRMENGYPATEMASLGVLSINDIKTSADGSLATPVKLRKPIFATKGESYAICVITSSDAYSLYTSTLNQADINTGAIISAPTYAGGTFFVSRNAETWTPEIDTSMKFDVLSATFATSATETYQPITITGQNFTDYQGNPIKDSQGNVVPLVLSRAVLLAKYLTPNNTSLNWEFRYVLATQPTNIDINSIAWQPFVDNVDVIFREQIRTIQIRVTFNGTGDAAPVLDIGGANLIAYKAATYGAYLSRNVSMAGTPFNHLRTQYEVAAPSGATVVPQYSVDKGKTWNLFDQGKIKTTQIDRDFVQYSYDLQLYNQAGGDTTKASEFKVRLNLTAQNSYGQPIVRRLMNSMSLQDGSEVGNDGYQAITPATFARVGMLLWGTATPEPNPVVTLSKGLSSLQTGFIVRLVDKFGADYEVKVPITDMKTDTAKTYTVGAETLSITQTSDTAFKMGGLTNLSVFEVDAY